MRDIIYMPVLKRGIRPIFLLLGTFLSLFLSILIVPIFLIMAYIMDLNYYGSYLPLLTLFALGIWAVVLLIPTIKAAKELTTIYTKDNNGNVTKYQIQMNNVTSFEEAAHGSLVGLGIDVLMGRFGMGLFTGQAFVKVVKGIALNNNKEFVMENLHNEEIYKVSKVYPSSDNYSIGKNYENIDSLEAKPIVPKFLIIKYTLITCAVLFGINLILFAFTMNADTSIQENHEEIAKDLSLELQAFGYENTSTRPVVFKREDGERNSTIKLILTNAGDVKQAEIDVYWELSEDADYVLKEIQALLDIIGLPYTETEYIEGLAEVQNESGLGYIERIDDYGIYLTKSSGKINLVINSR
ncbi:hypothetical protein [Ornithinibacillus halotolerans]|uniref:Uncharacterized protein n=1 Tax=Ornithinibacillus halotolerans TaxID=1274357 RepID=A0A916S181_9BACI|nr:hypothetical protein [Ornithinibacillus halotolerans]GGA79850.1 hypothetical protein GCM10008025_24100 [Ornithinibacillus halotolerans]